VEQGTGDRAQAHEPKSRRQTFDEPLRWDPPEDKPGTESGIVVVYRWQNRVPNRSRRPGLHLLDANGDQPHSAHELANH